MPLDIVAFSNRTDIGIFLLFVELSLEHRGYQFKRDIHDDFNVNDGTERVLISSYKLWEVI